MGTTERRVEIMKILCRRRHETMSNLASELGVSIRTIQRDVETLSLTEPIYTQTGKYNGGVYVVEGYSIDRIYMTEEEINLLKKIYISSENNITTLSEEEKKTFRNIIHQYEKIR